MEQQYEKVRPMAACMKDAVWKLTTGVECCVVEWVKRKTVRWVEHTERIKGEEFVKKMYGI